MSTSFRSAKSADTAAPTLRSVHRALRRSTFTTTPRHTVIIRARIDRLGEVGVASQDVPIEVGRALEVRPWLLRQLLAEGGQ
jgi:hypothetical protein